LSVSEKSFVPLIREPPVPLKGEPNGYTLEKIKKLRFSNRSCIPSYWKTKGNSLGAPFRGTGGKRKKRDQKSVEQLKVIRHL